MNHGQDDDALLSASQIVIAYGAGDRRTVDGVTLALRAGEVLGLLGGSGSGKSSLARVLCGLQPHQGGEVRFLGEPLASLGRQARRRYQRSVQMVFQNTSGSLNPRMRVGAAISEAAALRDGLGRREARKLAGTLLERVGLSAAWQDRYPHEFSGGQRQRIVIARALAPGPRVLICDEPVSALDAAVQARILDLLIDLQRSEGLACLLISHDIQVMGKLCHRIAVLHQGRIIESGPAAQVTKAPAHAYTRTLIDSIPRPKWEAGGE